jgi:hypothetical protein
LQKMPQWISRLRPQDEYFPWFFSPCFHVVDSNNLCSAPNSTGKSWNALDGNDVQHAQESIIRM